MLSSVVWSDGTFSPFLIALDPAGADGLPLKVERMNSLGCPGWLPTWSPAKEASLRFEDLSPQDLGTFTPVLCPLHQAGNFCVFF